MRNRTLVAAALFAALLAPRAASAAFANVGVGDEIRDRAMPTLDGGTARLLGDARASVFAFFRPGQANAIDTLRRLAGLERELAGKGVRFVAVTSASYDRAAVRRTLAASGAGMPVLLDEGDALYGELGVRSDPTVAVVDAGHRLAEYQPWLSVNLLDALRGRIQRVLGEISEGDLARVLDPPASGPATAPLDPSGHGALALAPDHFDAAIRRACAAERACAPRASPAVRRAWRVCSAR